MKEIRGKLIERISRTAQVESFRFSPEEKIDFQPGQFLQVIFDEQNRDNRNLNKYLSFSSAPGKPYIEVTKKLSESEFSKRLKGLGMGDEILFKAPLGNCVFKDENAKVAFLIGGVGITPVISILEYIFEKKLQTDACLLYSNATEADIAFKKEIDFWSQSAKNIKVHYTVVSCEPKDKTCFYGVINKEFLMGHLCDYRDRLIFIFGPPGMVSSMKQLCLEAGCPVEKIKTESFTGY